MNDELDRIRKFRADEPPPSTQTTQSARKTLLAAITPSPAPRRRRRRRLRVAFGVAGACAAVLVVLALGTGSSAPSSALAAALQRLARVAENQSPVVAPRPGQYLYVDSYNNSEADAYGDGRQCQTFNPTHRQIWIGSDGAGRLLETTGPTSFPTPQDRITCQQMHAVGSPGTSDLWFAPRCFDLGLASRLPAGRFADSATLLAQMRRIDGGPPGPGEDFVHVGDFLRESDASPALRAAIYRAAATIPGVKLLGSRTDHLGRRGVAIGFEGHGTLSELILDPRSSALLGEQTIAVATGRLAGWAAYRTSRIVAGIPARAPGPLTPPCISGGGTTRTVSPGVSIMTGASANG
jgi:hypothetical protein